MRAAPGGEAAGAVVLLGQERRAFPVRHRSARIPGLWKQPQDGGVLAAGLEESDNR